MSLPHGDEGAVVTGTGFAAKVLGMVWLALASAIGSVQAAPPSSGGEAVKVPLPREVVEKAGPAVPLIRVTTGGGERLGSGFVIGGDGVIVTALHLIEGAESISVSFARGRRFDETAVLAFDVASDLAVIRVNLPEDGAPLPSVRLADGSPVKPGDPVLVISNPLGLELTVTEGIASAWREPQHDDGDGEESAGATPVLQPLTRLLQISAAISPGSSGGPVFNEMGEVIGVAISGLVYGLAGLNFAVPVEGLPDLLDRAESMDLITFRERIGDVRLRLARPDYESAALAFEQNDPGEARRHVRRALRIYPTYAEALLLAGRLALKDGRVEGAREKFGAAVEADGEMAEGWYYLGVARGIQADDTNSGTERARAADAYSKALELDPRHARAAVALALIYLGDGLKARAEELLVQAGEGEPPMARPHYLLGELYLHEQRLGDAEDAFKAALWIDEDDALSHFGLARVYYRPRVRRESTRHWERFLELTKDNPALQAERERAIEIVREFYPGLAVP